MKPALVRIAIVFAVAGCAAAAAPEERFTVQAVRDAARACQAEGTRLWHKSLCGPLVLVHPGTRAAIANRPDPGGKFRQDGDVWAGVFPEPFTPSNTAIHWGGQEWSTVLLPLPRDPYQRLALLMHESFHRIQGSIGLEGSDAPNVHLDTEAGRLWLRLELRALARALRTPGLPGRQSASDAMMFRIYRHRLCAGSEPLEAAMEKQEGLAEYTGDAVALSVTKEDISRVARSVEAFDDSDAFARSFAYATGPALGLLLDRFAPGWRGRAALASLDSMLIAALHVPTTQDVAREAQRRAALYGYSAVAAAEREREERHQAYLADLKTRFLDGPVVDFPKADELNRSFNPRTLVPFPPHGTYYPTGVFSANWGKLEVESGGALLSPDNMSLRIPPPVDLEARPIRGAGWTLELAPGWTIQPAGRPGSFVVAPASQK